MNHTPTPDDVCNHINCRGNTWRMKTVESMHLEDSVCWCPCKMIALSTTGNLYSAVKFKIEKICK